MKKFKLFSQKEESTIIDGNKFNNKLKRVKNKIGKKIAIGTLCVLVLVSSIYLLTPIPVNAVDNDIYVTVEAGDTLSAIADQYNISYESLAEYNNISDPNKIEIGQVLKIPNETPECSEIDLDLWDSKLEQDGYVKGIDISIYQDEMDLEKVIQNNDINAVIVRAADFLSSDSCDDLLDNKAQVIRDNGIPFGIYFLPTFTNIEETEKEVNAILEKLKQLESQNIYCTLPIFIDIEKKEDGGGYVLERLGNQDPDAIESFNYLVNLFRKNGYEVMLYTSSYNYCDYGLDKLAQENNLDPWLAQYPPDIEGNVQAYSIEQNPMEISGSTFSCSCPHLIRQYTHYGSVNGYNDYVDLNLFYENIPKYIIENGLNHTNEMNKQEKSSQKQLRIVKIANDLFKK